MSTYTGHDYDGPIGAHNLPPGYVGAMSALSAVGAYERVTYRPEGGRARTVTLRHPRTSTTPLLGEVLTGIEVNAEGDEVADRGADERRHVICTALIVRRVPLAMDNLTGLLVVAP